ncbi:MAG: FAD-dependent oxidoreductase, partial [Gemmatimonadetes bacterium]|nr:FAD-dependent oxidoreductase [Gemmatimonadota bacterium]
LTSEGVSAVDYAWHRVDSLDVAAAHRDRANLPPEWAAFFRGLGNPGRCWVSVHCFEPRALLERFLLPAIAAEPRLKVFYQTVPVAVTRAAGAITELRAVQRFARAGDGYGRLLSAAIGDWYDPQPSPYFAKRVLMFRGPPNRPAVFIDATPFGDLLVLADAGFLQGTDAVDGEAGAGAEQCGQALVFPFVLAWDTAAFSQPIAAAVASAPGDTVGLTLGTYDWSAVWTYRRLRAAARDPGPGDLSMQNWERGNDYFGRYLLLPIAAARAQARSGWRGGVDTAALAGAERRALAWAGWFAAHAPPESAGRLRLATDVLDTGTGLSKLPYLRDTRRSIGLDGYVLPGRDLAATPGQVTGPAYADRVALGAYPFDFRVLPGCPRPAEAGEKTLPYFIPFRALTNRDVPNLLVAGRTMAQSSVANGATRLQPEEWTSGLAAGVAAAFLARQRQSTTDALRDIARIQERIRRYAPLEWTIGGRRYPADRGVT